MKEIILEITRGLLCGVTIGLIAGFTFMAVIKACNFEIKIQNSHFYIGGQIKDD